jgi:hypothetical protein
MRYCLNRVIAGSSDKFFPSTSMSINVTISLIFTLSIIQHTIICQKWSAGQNTISNLAGIVTKALLQFHNYSLDFPIISYKGLISRKQSPFHSRDIANIVFLNDDRKLRY